MTLDQWMILLLTEHIIGTIIGIFAVPKIMDWWIKIKYPTVGRFLK